MPQCEACFLPLIVGLAKAMGVQALIELWEVTLSESGFRKRAAEASRDRTKLNSRRGPLGTGRCGHWRRFQEHYEISNTSAPVVESMAMEAAWQVTHLLPTSASNGITPSFSFLKLLRLREGTDHDRA
ncbi:unnamed protein product [Symbiodinium natans]|uniref:Uncharacterized protein n=1 Tax=Symbiodinium natans TaxID=878477 RepID=A0A812RIQ1_9DINO|nr:unnamed protein product [Symbiodinium natans]